MALATLTIDVNARLANIERDLGKAAHIAEKNSKRMESAFAGAKAAFVGLGAALGTGALLAGIKNIINEADDLAKASRKFGVAVEDLSALKYAGALSDVSLEAIGNGLKKLSVNMLDTAAGTGEAKDAFEALGISVTDAGGGLKASDQVLAELADKFAGMEDGAGKTALAVKILGRAGADMIPLLNAGSKGLAEMKKEAEQLGVIVGGDLTQKSEEFNDNLTRISATLDAVKISLAGGVIGKLVEITDAFIEAKKATDGFLSALRLLDGDQASNPVAALEEVDARLAKLKKTRDEIAGSTANRSIFRDLPFLGTAGDLSNLDTQIKFAEQQRQALQALADKRGAFDFGPQVWTTKSKAPTPASASKKTADDEITQMRKLGEEYGRMFEAAEKYTAGLDAQIAKGRALTQAEQQLLEIERQLPKEWAGAIKPLLERADALEKQKKNMEEGEKLYEETRTEMEQLAAVESRLAELLAAGAITWDTYARALFAAQDRIKETKKPLDEMTEFVRQAARNMQDAMADGFFNIMQGKFDDLAGNFKQTIDRMVANLLASQLMNFLTGDFGKTGQMGGVFGNLFKDLLPSYDVGTDFVPRTGPAIIHRGERIVPAAQNRPGATGVTVVYNFTLQQPADRRTQEQIAALAGASIQTALARGA